MQFAKLTTEQEIRKVIQAAGKTPLAVDTETTGLNWRKDKLLSIVIGNTECAYSFDPQFAPLLKEIQGLLVFQNFKFDCHMLLQAGVDLRGMPMRDIMLMDHLADENREHGLDAMVQRYFQDDYKSVFWGKYKTFEEAPDAERLEYECKDVIYTARIYNVLTKELAEQSVPDSLVEHARRLALALFDTEHRGIKVDLNYTVELGTQLKEDIIKTEKSLRDLGGVHCEIIELEQWAKEVDRYKTDKRRATVQKPEFNFSASGQVCALLYDQLKLPPQFNQKTKSRTADDKALERLGDAHPILPEIRKLRKLSKMYSAFIESILEKADDGRIYPSFSVNGTVTGRISHSEPNMGQMPSRGDWAKIRGIFVPEPGYKLITCDYGMLEVVIAAHFSQDKNLLRIIHEGASKHDITAEALGIPRQTAKTVNFALQYLCQPQKVAEIVGCSKEQGQHYWNKYWETYEGEKRVVDECEAKVNRGEPIRNPFGRLRRFPSQFENRWEKASAYRQAYSSLIQGTGADITSRAFYLIAEKLSAEGWGRAWMTIHDEVLAEVRDDAVEPAREFIQQTMVGIGPEIGLTCPLTVDCSEGLDRWQK